MRRQKIRVEINKIEFKNTKKLPSYLNRKTSPPFCLWVPWPARGPALVPGDASGGVSVCPTGQPDAPETEYGYPPIP